MSKSYKFSKAACYIKAGRNFGANFLIVASGLLLFSSCKNSTTITVLGENSSNLQSMQSLKGGYEQANNITIEYKPNTFEDAYAKANQDFSSKSGLYDIVLQYNFSLSNFVRNNYVYRYTELAKDIPVDQKAFESDIFPNVWKEVGYYYKNPADHSEGIDIIGYPFAANSLLMAYNKKMFEDTLNKKRYKDKYHQDLLPPATWEQYKQIADFFTDKNKKTYGVCMEGAAGGWLYYEWCQYLQGFGGKIMDKEWGWMGDKTSKIFINTAQGKAATAFMLSLKQDNAGAFVNTDGNQEIDLMKKGNVAMCLIWSDYVRGLSYDGENIDRRFGVTPVPGTQSMLAGGSFFISRQSAHPKEAFKYVMSLMQKDNQVKLMQRGLCSPLRSAYDADEVQGIPYIKALKASLDRGVYALEAGPDADIISGSLTNYLQQLWKGKISADDALQEAQQEIIVKRQDTFK